jgi:hypothetical protein
METHAEDDGEIIIYSANGTALLIARDDGLFDVVRVRDQLNDMPLSYDAAMQLARPN